MTPAKANPANSELTAPNESPNCPLRAIAGYPQELKAQNIPQRMTTTKIANTKGRQRTLLESSEILLTLPPPYIAHYISILLIII